MLSQKETNTHAHIHRQSQSNTGWQGIRKGFSGDGSGGFKPRLAHKQTQST